MLSFLVILAASYLLGSIPTSIWVGRIYKGVDIREHGSGNAGATNTFRILGWRAGVIVALVDLGKGFTAAYFISRLGYEVGELPLMIYGWETKVFVQIFAGLFAVIGHMYSLYAKFSGGKGVITAAGMLFAVEPVSISISIGAFIIVLFSSRYVSLASIIATFVYPFTLLLFRYGLGWNIDGSLIVIASIVSAGIIIKHHANIKRLMQGNENRVRSFKPAKGWLNKKPAA